MPTYPLSLEAHWQDVTDVDLPQSLLDWLIEPNSLTKRLKSHCQRFTVEVLSEQIFDASAHVSELFKAHSQQVRVREVVLFCDTHPMVYAQSWIPEQPQLQANIDLRHLGDKPLGEVIFQDPKLSRQQIQIADFSDNGDVARLCANYQLPCQPLWGRRSRFDLTGQQIMVCEVFLPGAYPYL